MTKKGWPQNLDNGPIGKPSIPGPQPRAGTQQGIGKNMDFFSAIAKGENPNGQTTHAPGQVVCGGEVCYEQERYPRDYQGGSRWSPKRK